MECAIRKFEKRDADSMLTLGEDGWEKQIDSLTSTLLKIDSDNTIELFYVAEYNDEIIGFIWGWALPSGTLIPEFAYVRKEFRRNGVAQQLLNRLEQDSACSISMIFYNKELHNHYAKQGYITGDELETAIKNL